PYAYYREQATIFREDRIYDECSKLVLNPDAASKAPERSQACMNTMPVIDLGRARRREEAALTGRRAEVAYRRRRVEYLQMQAELARQRQETEAADRRRENAARAIQDAFRPSPSTHTTCHTYGNMTTCDSM